MVNKNYATLHFLHKHYIKETVKKAIVKNETIVLCNLTKAVMRGCDIQEKKVYITARVLKHLYDKRTAVHYELILNHLHQIIKYPDNIYKNVSGKRGNIGLSKTIFNTLMYATVEKITNEEGQEELYIATVFETDKKYLQKNTLIWSWRGGNSSS